MMNKVVLKKYGIILLSVIMLNFCGCIAVKNALPLNDIVMNLLAENSVEKSKIVSLFDSNSNDFVSDYNEASKEITDEELKKYVDDLLLSHKTGSKAYTSSDQYILDYYGVETEEEFLAECKIRLEQIKQFENKNSADNEFLDKVAEKCKFYINKKEAAAYSEQIVKYHKDLAYISDLELNEYIKQTLKMTEDEFYDYCYDEGVKEIKRYLLVGAYTNGKDFDNKYYDEFCSMNGYDSTQEDNTQAKFDYLKTVTVHDFEHLMVNDVAYYIPFDNKKSYSVQLYDSSNVYAIDFSATKGYEITQELQEEFKSAVNGISFGGTPYVTTNHLYQTVIVLKDEGKVFAKVMVDEINGFVKWQQNDGQIVCAELKENLRELIERAKQG